AELPRRGRGRRARVEDEPVTGEGVGSGTAADANRTRLRGIADDEARVVVSEGVAVVEIRPRVRTGNGGIAEVAAVEGHVTAGENAAAVPPRDESDTAGAGVLIRALHLETAACHHHKT